MKPSPRLLLLSPLILFAFLAACNTPQPTATTTPTPLPTKTLIPTLAISPSPTDTSTPRETEPSPVTPTPSEQDQVAPDAVHMPSLIPFGAVARFGRGILSKITYSPAQNYLAIGTSVGVCVYDAHTMEELWCDRTEGWVDLLAFKPDESGLLGATGNLVLWDVQTGTRLAVSRWFDNSVNAMAWWPDGSQVLVQDGGGTVYTLADGTLEFGDVLIRHPANNSQLLVSPDGTTLAWDEGNQVVLWDLHTESRAFELTLPEFQYVTGMAWTQNGRELVVSSGIYGGCGGDCELLLAGTLTFWDVRTGAQTRSITAEALLGEPAWILGAALSPDESQIAVGVATADIPLEILILDAQTFNIVATINEARRVWMINRTRPYNSYLKVPMVWMPDSQQLLYENAHGNLSVWNPEIGGSEPFLEIFNKSIDRMSLSPDGRLLATSMENTTLVWDAVTGEILRTIHNENYPTHLAWSPQKNWLVYGNGSRLEGWDFTTGKGGVVTETVRPVQTFSWSPTGGVIALVYTDTVSLLDMTTSQTTSIFESNLGFENQIVSWSSDGTRLARAWYFSFSGGAVEIWNIQTGQMENTFPIIWNLFDFAWMPGAERVAGLSDRIFFWDTQTGELNTRWPSIQFPNSLSMLAFSPDGRILASAGNEITLWDTTTGDILATLAGHTSTVSALTFSPDGNLLYSSSYDGTIIIWEIPQ